MIGGFSIVGSNLRSLLFIETKGALETRLVSRWGLRACLAQQAPIVWGKKFLRYEELEDRVKVYFAGMKYLYSITFAD